MRRDGGVRMCVGVCSVHGWVDVIPDVNQWCYADLNARPQDYEADALSTRPRPLPKAEANLGYWFSYAISQR